MPQERRRSQVYDHYPQVKEGTVPDVRAEQPTGGFDDVLSLASLQKVSFARDQARAASSYAVSQAGGPPYAPNPSADAPYTDLILEDPSECTRDRQVVKQGVSGFHRHRFEAPVAWISKSEVAWMQGREHSASGMRRHSAVADQSFVKRKAASPKSPTRSS